MSAPSKFLVGIDLGTTNIVVSYCEYTEPLEQSKIQLFPIPQLIGPGEVVAKPQLPSFRYHPATGQFQDQNLSLPWDNEPLTGDLNDVVVGEWARQLGSQVEGRQVSSAKSWLSHSGVDRSADILPWVASEDVAKVSPVIASASYLNHIRLAWNHAFSSSPLEKQELVVTVPASFDETARALTIEACHLAGLGKPHLLEEPQAVVYDWYARNQANAKEKLNDINDILVVDIGGGTTDLSLIQASQTDQALSLNRTGVGEHLMLGGDNIDLALAHLAERQLGSSRLSAARLSKLIQQTRQAKEQLLSGAAQESSNITLLGSGSKLIGGSKTVPITKTNVEDIALTGYFPLTSSDERPAKKRAAVVEFGLPYANEPAISKHIAEFLHIHNQGKVPDALLLNGGAFNSPIITSRVQTLLTNWRGQQVTTLHNPSPDLAVAQGAVAYAKALKGAQLKIGGGSARSFLLSVGKSNAGHPQAVCLMAKGTEEGEKFHLSSRRFQLTVGQPVRFDLFTSLTTQYLDQELKNGQIVPLDAEQVSPLPPMVVTIAADQLKSKESSPSHLSSQLTTATHQNRKQIEVTLTCQLTSIGTLEITCHDVQDSSKTYELNFELRKKSAPSEDAKAANSPSNKTKFDECEALITQAYSGNKKAADPKQIKGLAKILEKRLGNKDAWDLQTSRSVFDALVKGRKRRRRSEDHEKNWLRLAGFGLRPGFGDLSDTWRVDQIWPLFEQGIQFENHQGWSDWWVFWRRVSGGLNQEQQEMILAKVAKHLHPGATNSAANLKKVHALGYESMVRLAASLEHLHYDDKTLLATWFFNKAQRSSNYTQSHWWALARLGSRFPMYGSKHNLIPLEQVEKWLNTMLELDWKQEPSIGFAVANLARQTGDRTSDINPQLRESILLKLTQSKAPKSWYDMVYKVAELEQKDSNKLYGDSLPQGLVLIRS